MPGPRGLLARVGNAIWSPADIAEATRLDRAIRASKPYDMVKKGEEPFEHEGLTEFERKVAEMARNLYSNDEIAEEMETSVGSIKSTLTRLRIDRGIDIPHASHGRPPEMQERVNLLIRAGRSNEAIAELLGLTPNNVGVKRNHYNKTLPVGQRYHSKGYRYAFPLIGAPTGGLLSRLQTEDE